MYTLYPCMDVLQKNIWEDIHVIPGSDGHNSPKLETVQMPFKSRMKKIVVDVDMQNRISYVS